MIVMGALLAVFVVAVIAIVALREIAERRRQRDYRAALRRKDWAEVERLMGLDP